MNMKMTKKVAMPLLFIAGLVVGGGIGLLISQKNTQTNVTGGGHIEGRVTVQGTSFAVPYDITGTYPATVVRQSPDKKRLLYSRWNNARIALYVSDLNGDDAKKVAEQEVAEGSGELDMGSIQWSDNETIAYVETGLRCADASCASPDDFVSVRTMYTVDIQTGKKTSVTQ